MNETAGSSTHLTHNIFSDQNMSAAKFKGVLQNVVRVEPQCRLPRDPSTNQTHVLNMPIVLKRWYTPHKCLLTGLITTGTMKCCFI